MAMATSFFARSFFHVSPSHLGRLLPHLSSIPFRKRTSLVTSASQTSSPAAARIELAQTKILLDGKELTIIQPRDVDQVLDMYIEQGRLDGDPYWCRIWPSAVVLAEEILKNPLLVASLHVCDLGSGLGLAGLAAAVAGAREVVFYDQEPLALLCSLLSVHANIPRVITNSSTIVQLICGDSKLGSHGTPVLPLWKSVFSLPSLSHHPLGEHQMENAESSMLTVRAELFNWCEEHVRVGKFDMVLACDVLYEKSAVPFVAKLLPRLLLSSDSGKVLVTDPTHRTPQNRQQLLNLLSNYTGSKVLKLERRDRRIREENGISDDVELMYFISSISGGSPQNTDACIGYKEL